jgi:hypothetical protein
VAAAAVPFVELGAGAMSLFTVTLMGYYYGPANRAA